MVYDTREKRHLRRRKNTYISSRKVDGGIFFVGMLLKENLNASKPSDQSVV